MGERAQKPRFVTCGTGVLLSVVFGFIALALLPTLTILITGVVMWVPNQLGVMPEVSPSESVEIVAPVQEEIQLWRVGYYDIFSRNEDGLPAYTIVLSSEATGQPIFPERSWDFGVSEDGGYLTRLSPAPAPVFTFFIWQPGAYTLSARYKGELVGPQTTLLIIPNVAPVQDLIFVVTLLIYGTILTLIGKSIYGRLNKDKIVTQAEAKSDKRDKWAAMMGEQGQEQEE